MVTMLIMVTMMMIEISSIIINDIISILLSSLFQLFGYDYYILL